MRRRSQSSALAVLDPSVTTVCLSPPLSRSLQMSSAWMGRSQSPRHGGGGGGRSHGIDLNAAHIESTGVRENADDVGAATITIVGTGGAGTNFNNGMQIRGNSLITSVDGNIAITGTAGTGSSFSYGVYAYRLRNDFFDRKRGSTRRRLRSTAPQRAIHRTVLLSTSNTAVEKPHHQRGREHLHHRPGGGGTGIWFYRSYETISSTGTGADAATITIASDGARCGHSSGLVRTLPAWTGLSRSMGRVPPSPRSM